MKKIFILLTSIFLLAGCSGGMALLAPATGATNGKIVQSSLKSAASYAVKQTTGKTPLQHALSYAEKKNPNKKKKRCISFIKQTNSEACMIVNKQIALAQTSVKKKMSSTQTVVKKKAQVFLVKTVEIKNKPDNFIQSTKPARIFFLKLRSKIEEYDARWLARVRKNENKNLN